MKITERQLFALVLITYDTMNIAGLAMSRKDRTELINDIMKQQDNSALRDVLASFNPTNVAAIINYKTPF